MEQKKDIDLKLMMAKKQPGIYTTFRISQGAHYAIKVISELLGGIKYAEVFDKLVSIFEVFEESKHPISLKVDKNIVTTRKTYVVDKGTLAKLKKVTKKNKIARDLLIERTALKFLEMLKLDESSRKKEYKDILEKELIPLAEKVENLENELYERFGSTDPLPHRLGYIQILFSNLIMAIENNLSNGTPIDPDDYSQES